MSFFEKSSGGELPPPGTYYAVLSELKVEMQDDYNDPTQKVQRVRWTWTTTSFRQTDSKPVLIFEWTGPRYGNPKANLTKRLDALYPKLTLEQRAELEPSQMVNVLMAQIELVRERNDKGEPKNILALLKPIKALPESSWLPDEEEDEDYETSPIHAAGLPAVPAPPGLVAPPPTPAEEGDPFADDSATSEQLAEITTLCQQLKLNEVNTSQIQYDCNPTQLTLSQASDFLLKLRKQAGQRAASQPPPR